MKFVLRGTKMKGFIDGKLLAEVTDSSAESGMAILASSYDGNLFDNLAILPAGEN